MPPIMPQRNVSKTGSTGTINAVCETTWPKLVLRVRPAKTEPAKRRLRLVLPRRAVVVVRGRLVRVAHPTRLVGVVGMRVRPVQVGEHASLGSVYVRRSTQKSVLGTMCTGLILVVRREPRLHRVPALSSVKVGYVCSWRVLKRAMDVVVGELVMPVEHLQPVEWVVVPVSPVLEASCARMGDASVLQVQKIVVALVRPVAATLIVLETRHARGACVRDVRMAIRCAMVCVFFLRSVARLVRVEKSVREEVASVLLV